MAVNFQGYADYGLRSASVRSDARGQTAASAGPGILMSSSQVMANIYTNNYTNKDEDSAYAKNMAVYRSTGSGLTTRQARDAPGSGKHLESIYGAPLPPRKRMSKPDLAE